METNQRNHSNLWRGLMVGSILGAAAGFLLAPESGKELRSDIKGKTNEAFEETKRFYSDRRTKFRNALASVAGRREKTPLNDIESPEEIVGDA
jgi:gas vesicle protein